MVEVVLLCSETEVGELDGVVVVHQYVLELDIVMSYTMTMHIAHSDDHLLCKTHKPVLGEVIVERPLQTVVETQGA
jgi:hypothetical protein